MLDTFTTAYIECILFAGIDDNDQPLDKNYSASDFSTEAMEKVQADCRKFQTENAEMIANDLEIAGHDFWLTRNGHGAGFWDGDWDEHGSVLTAAAKKFGECDVYAGDDGLIYLS